MNFDDLKNYIVCLNGGTGVVFQPEDANFSYILTARHIFEGVDARPYKGMINIAYYCHTKKQFVEETPVEKQKELNYFPHKDRNIDLAVLKVARLDCPGDLMFKQDSLGGETGYNLAGFPNLRRVGDKITLNWVRLDMEVTLLQDLENKRREADCSKNPILAELKGTSGGGLFKIVDGMIFLAGIQSSVVSEEERMGRVEFTPVLVISEIIHAYTGHLEELLPYYMKAFGFSKDKAFHLRPAKINSKVLAEVARVLLKVINDVCKTDFNPAHMVNKLGPGRMLLPGQHPQSVYLKFLWRYWLEVIAILSIVRKRRIVKDDLDEVFQQVRLLHAETTDDFWSDHLASLDDMDYTGLADAGVVLVSSLNPPQFGQYQLERETIPGRIDRVRADDSPYIQDFVYGEEKDKTSAGTDFPYDKYTFIHLEYFKQKLISEDYQEYAGKDEYDIKKLLNTKYGEHIK